MKQQKNKTSKKNMKSSDISDLENISGGASQRSNLDADKYGRQGHDLKNS